MIMYRYHPVNNKCTVTKLIFYKLLFQDYISLLLSPVIRPFVFLGATKVVIIKGTYKICDRHDGINSSYIKM